MLKILVTNDDGINSPGIYHLANNLKKLGSVTVVAPESERSASGLSITMHKPLRLSSIDSIDKNIDSWSINGTPSDCVKFALDFLINEKPDLIVSGINRGSNLGTDILYSGTVSAAIEGAINSIPSIAISLDTFENVDFNSYGRIALSLCKQIYEKKIEKGLVLNINFPHAPLNCINGIKVTRLGVRKYKNCFVKRKDPRGKNYFWLAGELDDSDNNESDTDINAIKNNYISITPIKIDLTSYETIDKLNNWGLNIES